MGRSHYYTFTNFPQPAQKLTTSKNKPAQKFRDYDANFEQPATQELSTNKNNKQNLYNKNIKQTSYEVTNEMLEAAFPNLGFESMGDILARKKRIRPPWYNWTNVNYHGREPVVVH